jgi:hypothetical protein
MSKATWFLGSTTDQGPLALALALHSIYPTPIESQRAANTKHLTITGFTGKITREWIHFYILAKTKRLFATHTHTIGRILGLSNGRGRVWCRRRGDGV